MNKRPDINRLIEFNQVLLKLRAIDRKVFIPPENKVPENDSEHSYSLAMMAWFLAQYIPDVNTDKIIRIALAHDLIEVHTGDTFSYDKKHILDSKKDREFAALNRLAKEWPDAPEIIEEIKEYEDLKTKEAKFVYALDKLMPSIMDYTAKGEDWHRLNITFEMFMKEKESKIPVSDEIYEYHKQLVKLINQNPGLFPDAKNQTKTK